MHHALSLSITQRDNNGPTNNNGPNNNNNVNFQNHNHINLLSNMHVRAFQSLAQHLLRLFATVRSHLAPDLFAITAAFITNNNNRYTFFYGWFVILWHSYILLLIVALHQFSGMSRDLLSRSSVVEECTKANSNWMSIFLFYSVQ